MTDFEAIYAQYCESVYRYVFSLCRNEQDAQELTQDAFYRAMEHMGQFRGECSLYVRLCQIAKNAFFTREKKRRRHQPLAEDVPDGTGDPVLRWLTAKVHGGCTDCCMRWTSRTKRCSLCACSVSCHSLRSASCSAKRTAGRGWCSTAPKPDSERS